MIPTDGVQISLSSVEEVWDEVDGVDSGSILYWSGEVDVVDVFE